LAEIRGLAVWVEVELPANGALISFPGGLGVGSHSYGHFEVWSLILLVMVLLGPLQPFAVLVSAVYFILLYLLAGIFLDSSVGWPPAATFVIGNSSPTVSGIIAIWLTSFPIGFAAPNFS
jgi:hypothetical protein